MEVIKQSFSVQYNYSVWFTRGVFDPDNALLNQVLKTSYCPKLLLIVDAGVHNHHPDLIRKWKLFSEKNQKFYQAIVEPLIIKGGEDCKNDPQVAETIIKAIDRYHIDRHSLVLAVGGGAVLDVVGYAAAIAHRGIRLIRIPTTVLAQNDSGVGVKNGVNAFGKKNFLGTFAPPYAVINDSDFLRTLDDRDWRAGIAEAIKVALIKDEHFFKTIEQQATALNNRDQTTMEQLIYRCAQMHVQHIAAGDPFEQGSSRPLDFGHWSAHKLEQLTNYQIRHGEAVAMGMALDCTYAKIKGFISESDLQRILKLFHDLNFDLFHQAMLTPALLTGLQEFREHLGGKLTILLLQGIGASIEVHEMDEEVLLESIHHLQSFSVETDP